MMQSGPSQSAGKSSSFRLLGRGGLFFFACFDSKNSFQFCFIFQHFKQKSIFESVLPLLQPTQLNLEGLSSADGQGGGGGGGGSSSLSPR